MAQHVNVIMDKLSSYADLQLLNLSKNNALIALSQPLIIRALNNNLYKLEFVLKQIADKDGLVDIDNILSEMIENITSMQPSKIDTGVIGELEIKDGTIKMNLPFVNKALIFNKQDLLNLKDALTK